MTLSSINCASPEASLTLSSGTLRTSIGSDIENSPSDQNFGGHDQLGVGFDDAFGDVEVELGADHLLDVVLDGRIPVVLADVVDLRAAELVLDLWPCVGGLGHAEPPAVPAVVTLVSRPELLVLKDLEGVVPV